MAMSAGLFAECRSGFWDDSSPSSPPSSPPSPLSSDDKDGSFTLLSVSDPRPRASFMTNHPLYEPAPFIPNMAPLPGWIRRRHEIPKPSLDGVVYTREYTRMRALRLAAERRWSIPCNPDFEDPPANCFFGWRRFRIDSWPGEGIARPARAGLRRATFAGSDVKWRAWALPPTDLPDEQLISPRASVLACNSGSVRESLLHSRPVEETEATMLEHDLQPTHTVVDGDTRMGRPSLEMHLQTAPDDATHCPHLSADDKQTHPPAPDTHALATSAQDDAALQTLASKLRITHEALRRKDAELARLRLENSQLASLVRHPPPSPAPPVPTPMPLPLSLKPHPTSPSSKPSDPTFRRLEALTISYVGRAVCNLTKDPVHAECLLIEALAFAQQTRFAPLVGMCAYWRGHALYRMAKYAEALREFESAAARLTGVYVREHRDVGGWTDKSRRMLDLPAETEGGPCGADEWAGMRGYEMAACAVDDASVVESEARDAILGETF